MPDSAWTTWAWRLVLVAALAQFAFMILEGGFWQSYVAPRVAGLDPETAGKTVPLGWNMGLYNGLVGAGLVWALFTSPAVGLRVAVYLALFMLIAGIVGGLTVRWTIFALQGVPGGLALVALLRRF